MAFKERTGPELTADTPEQLFVALNGTGTSSRDLLRSQVDILRDYNNRGKESPDLALELPTGTGKTLIGLLVADWRRRTYGKRAIYACPTVQLVEQVVRTARDFRIPVVDLSGTWKSWDLADQAKYTQGQAIAVVTYNAIFNSSPKLEHSDVIIFDDAHVGEQYISGSYTVEITRAWNQEFYNKILEIVGPLLGKERHRQLGLEVPGGGTKELVDGIFLAQFEDLVESLGNVLGELRGILDDETARRQSFAYTAIQNHLTACTLYISWDKIQIRPATPPTFDNKLFGLARQRLYLSATLGDAGELERAFGRSKIKRLELPKDAPVPRSGRRFFVFPHLVKNVDPEEFTRELIETVGKALVIAPSTALAEIAENTLVPNGMKVYSAQEFTSSLDKFIEDEKAVAFLANRYDGIDLPDEACRGVVMAGYPGVTNLQEQFYSERSRASAMLEERIRSRVVQGLGRCTRNKDDWAVVIVADTETTTYLCRPEVQKRLSPDLAAEIYFGVEQSMINAEDVRENIGIFLDQGEEWEETDTKFITSYSMTLHRETEKISSDLALAARNEVEAMEDSWTGNWAEASRKLHDAAEKLMSHSEARGYRATLLFRAAVLSNKAGRDRRDDTLLQQAVGMSQEAVKAAKPSTWMNMFLPLDDAETIEDSAALGISVAKINEILDKSTSAEKFWREFGEMKEGLAQTEAKKYEGSLKALGKFLGASADKPSAQARADSVWCWENEVWITLEAKSEHDETNQIGPVDIRQLASHLKLLSKDRKVPIASNSAAVLISPRTTVSPDAMTVADENSWRVTFDHINQLVEDAERLWSKLRQLGNVSNAEIKNTGIAEALREYRLQPEEILDRLTVVPVSGN